MSEEQHVPKLLDCISNARASFRDAWYQISVIEELKRTDINSENTKLIFGSFGEDIVGTGTAHIVKRHLSTNAGICLGNALRYLNRGLSDVRSIIWHILNDPVPESLETWTSSKSPRAMASSIFTRAVFMDDEVRKLYLDHTKSPNATEYRISEDTSWENNDFFNIYEMSSLHYKDGRLPKVVQRDGKWFVDDMQTNIPLVDSCIDRIIKHIDSIRDGLPGGFSDQDEVSPDLLDRIDEVSLHKFLINLERFATDLASIYAVKNSFQYFLNRKTSKG